jgi:hypothetical protein
VELNLLAIAGALKPGNQNNFKCDSGDNNQFANTSNGCHVDRREVQKMLKDAELRMGERQSTSPEPMRKLCNLSRIDM